MSAYKSLGESMSSPAACSGVIHGDELMGTTSSPRGESELTNLSFEDGQLSFEVVRIFGERTMTQQIKATINGDEMTGTISDSRGGERPFNVKRKAT